MKLKKLTSLFLAGAMALSLAACGGSAGSTASTAGTGETGTTAESTDAGDLPVLKVAVMPFLNSLPIEYMVENKLDEANGFKIETVYFSNGGAMNEALAADQWEVGTLSAAAVNSLAIYGAYCIADIGHSEGGLYTLVNADSPIAQAKGTNPSYPDVLGSPETVKGAVIATSTGTISHLNVNKWLEVLGLTPDDVQIVSMDF
ncbi:MAG TPA: ABC transporter substrate-binding protein, partial [Subdoligranulum variabile]|nr:ABC transporter substrate-binding protein [Subdoligranulum variabile]